MHAGMISPEWVARFQDGINFNKGNIATITALRTDLTFTLHSFYFQVVDPYPNDGTFILTAYNNNNQTMGTYRLPPDMVINPYFIDFANPTVGNLTGTFQNVFSLKVSGGFWDAMVDNMYVTPNYDPDAILGQRELVWEPVEGLPQHRAPAEQP